MKIKIHLGAHEIEGTYIQLSNKNTSLLTDLVTKDRLTGKYQQAMNIHTVLREAFHKSMAD